MDDKLRKPGIVCWGALIAVCLALAYPLLFPFVLRVTFQRRQPVNVEKLALRVYRPLLERAGRFQWPWWQYANRCGVDDEELGSMRSELAYQDHARELREKAKRARKPAAQ